MVEDGAARAASAASASSAGPTAARSAAAIDAVIIAYIRGLMAADYSPRTIEAARSDLGQFAAFLEARAIEEIAAVRREHIGMFVEYLAEGPMPPSAGESPATADTRGRPCARSTIARKLSVIRRFLRFCKENGLIETSPARCLSFSR